MNKLNEFTLGDCCDIAEEATKRLAVEFTKAFGDKYEPPTISTAMVRHVLQVAAEMEHFWLKEWRPEYPLQCQPLEQPQPAAIPDDPADDPLGTHNQRWVRVDWNTVAALDAMLSGDETGRMFVEMLMRQATEALNTPQPAQLGGWTPVDMYRLQSNMNRGKQMDRLIVDFTVSGNLVMLEDSEGKRLSVYLPDDDVAFCRRTPQLSAPQPAQLGGWTPLPDGYVVDVGRSEKLEVCAGGSILNTRDNYDDADYDVELPADVRLCQRRAPQPPAMPEDVREIIVTVLEDERDRHIINGGKAEHRKEIEAALAWLAQQRPAAREE